MPIKTTPTYGFTLIELMFVISIISILAAVAIPNYANYLKRAKVSEAFMLTGGITKTIADYYSFYGKFPKNNQVANLPKPQDLSGQYIKSIQIENGAIHVLFKQNMGNATLSLRPAVVNSYPPTNILVWVCGYAAMEGWTVVGENKTDIESVYLPRICLSN